MYVRTHFYFISSTCMEANLLQMWDDHDLYLKNGHITAHLPVAIVDHRSAYCAHLAVKNSWDHPIWHLNKNNNIEILPPIPVAGTLQSRYFQSSYLMIMFSMISTHLMSNSSTKNRFLAERLQGLPQQSAMVCPSEPSL